MERFVLAKISKFVREKTIGLFYFWKKKTAKYPLFSIPQVDTIALGLKQYWHSTNLSYYYSTVEDGDLLAASSYGATTNQAYSMKFDNKAGKYSPLLVNHRPWRPKQESNGNYHSL